MFLIEVFWSFQKQPATIQEDIFLLLSLEQHDLASAYLVNRFIELLHDMEAIKDVQSVWCLFLDYLEIWWPHIATDIFEILTALFAKFMKEPEQGLCLALHAAPE